MNGERQIIFDHVVPWITYMMLLNLKDTFSTWESQFVTKLLQVQDVGIFTFFLYVFLFQGDGHVDVGDV